MDNNGKAHHIVLSKQRHHVILYSDIRPSLLIGSNVPKITNVSGCLIIPRSSMRSFQGVKVSPSNFTILGQIPILMDMEAMQTRAEVEYYTVDFCLLAIWKLVNNNLSTQLTNSLSLELTVCLVNIITMTKDIATSSSKNSEEDDSVHYINCMESRLPM